jgi:hypothetical protein
MAFQTLPDPDGHPSNYFGFRYRLNSYRRSLLPAKIRSGLAIYGKSFAA